jgi:hypothetical protein
MKFPIWVIAIVLTALGGQGSAQALASLVVYNDKATFLQETASVSASGKIPNIGAIDGGIKVLGSVKISLIPPSSRLYVGSGKGNEDFTSLTPGNDIAVSGSENLLFELKRPSYAFGFGLVEPSIDCRVAVCIDSTFEATLKDGANVVGAFQFNVTDDTVSFIGVKSSMVFSSVEIRELTNSIDNEYFGEIFASENLPSDVGGCLQERGKPIINQTITLTQTGETPKSTTTDSTGCFGFDGVVEGKKFNLSLKGAKFPLD